MFGVKSIPRSALFVFILTLLLVTSCKEDPLSAEEDHFEAIGMAIFDASGKMVVQILRGVTADTLKGETNKRSDHFSVKFFDGSEKLIDPPDSEDSKFKWTIDDPNLFSIYQHPGEEGGYEFHIDGLKSGNTRIEFFIEHEGHNDYRTGKIPVEIK
ncbi:MAG TPA: hypothetical protein PLZ15_14875 [Melioribacteraceae bacterium]|nr:hypothetical protein [Melioribacteraceae bacterium]